MALPRPDPDANRARGEIRAVFARAGTRTEPASLYETGGYRLRLPRPHGSAPPEAVIVNTGGGMAGGDQVRLAFSCDASAAVTVTTTAAEKVYRSDGPDTTMEVAIEIGPGAALDWLPQETILFDGARLARRLDVAIAPDASCLIVEAVVFGRLAMGEVMRSGRLHDRWRVRRGGALLFADDLRIAGDIAATLERPALGGGARACASVLWVGPDAAGRLAEVRAALDRDDAVLAGASAWNGMLAVRAVARAPERLRAATVRVLEALRGRALPRLWR